MEIEKRVHPELKPILKFAPENVAEAWTPEGIAHLRVGVPLVEDPKVKISERYIPGPTGAPDIRVLIYEPRHNVEGLLPGILYLHGGGYATGGTQKLDAEPLRSSSEVGYGHLNYIYSFVIEANCVVAAPEYRLAPEDPFPAGVEDCYETLEWMAANASELRVDPARIGVTGNSAGGGLTIAVSLMARDRKGPGIRFQMPLYPTIDDRLNTPSNYEITHGGLVNREMCRRLWNMYLGEGHEEREISPYAAPAREKDYSGLPACYTFVGELDPHRDDTLAYITRLVQSGVPTGFSLYPGCFHGFELAVPQAAVSRQAVGIAVQAMKEGLWS